MLFRQICPRGDNLDHRHRRCVIIQDQRGRNTRRQLLQQGLRNRGDLSRCGADIYIGLEIDFDDAFAGQRLALGMFDIIDGGSQHALIGRDDAARHLVRR